MKKWFAALWAEAISWFWWSLSAVSTLSTFFFRGSWSGKLRSVFAISFVLSFAWANFRVFQKQERRLRDLSSNVASHETRIAELKITPYGGSYILHRMNDVPHAGFNGGFVDNSGLRNSVVDQYQLEIVELGASFPHLQPEEGRHAIRGRHCDQGLSPNFILSETGIVRINAENATRRGELIFFLPGLSLNQFADAGLRMTGEE